MSKSEDTTPPDLIHGADPLGARLYVTAVKGAHRAYKLTLSPFIGQACRFQPTCSDYMRDALILHGPVKGGWLGLKRLCNCRPGGGQGFDPVPPKT